jgi:prepilin-type N-terminal cleavage/methylation domain-containing protein
MTERGGGIMGEEGFTFNEVLVAITIAAVAILGYSVSSLEGIRAQTASDHLTVAIQLAQDKMEQLKSRRAIANENLCPGGGDQGLLPSGLPGGIFNRCWKITDSLLGGKLKQVDVTVSWRDYQDHQVTLSTLVYIGSL